MSERDRRRFRPMLETSEARVLLAGANVPAAFLFTPVADSAPLAQHIHPKLRIVIDGKTRSIPEGIGIGAPGEGNLPLHTHDASGIIHVESTQKMPFRLRDFFTVWGQTFTRKDILGHTADRSHKITMTVNGKASRAFGSLLLRDFQTIVIRYASAARGVRPLASGRA